MKTATKQDRIMFARTLKYVRRVLAFPAQWNANIPVPRADIRDRNIDCIVQALKKEGIKKAEAKAYCESLDAAADRPFYYVVLTVGYNAEYRTELKSPVLSKEIADLQYGRIVDSLRHDRTGNFYGVALMQVHNPVAIEAQVL